jgi:hypothetical protein
LPCGVVCVGAQPFLFCGIGCAASCAGGLVGVWALAAPDSATSTHDAKIERFICMPGKRPASAEVPQKLQDLR